MRKSSAFLLMRFAQIVYVLFVNLLNRVCGKQSSGSNLHYSQVE